MDQRTKCVSPPSCRKPFFIKVNINYQKNISNSQTTLPVVIALSGLLWFLLPDASHTLSWGECDYWMWRYVPHALTSGIWSDVAGFLFSTLAVFIMAELNNANMLLRVSSRMLSSTLAILSCLLLSFHACHPGHVLLILSMLALAPLMSSYQRPSPQLSFATFLLLSLSSLVFPKMLWSAPLYWIMLSMLRAMSTRCLLASVLALLIPYWLTGGVALYDGDWNSYIALLKSIIDFSSCDYGSVPVTTIVPFAYFVLLFAIGSIDFYINRYKDKTRTRMYLHAILVHGCYYTIFIALQPQHSLVLMPLLLISSSIMYGHYFTLTQTKQSHVLNIVLLVMGVAVIVFQYDIPIAQYADTTLSTIQQWIHSISFL